jgi:hypothetical protein
MTNIVPFCQSRPGGNVIPFSRRTPPAYRAESQDLYRVGDRVRFRNSSLRGVVYDTRPDFGRNGWCLYYVMLISGPHAGMHISAYAQSIEHDTTEGPHAS